MHTKYLIYTFPVSSLVQPFYISCHLHEAWCLSKWNIKKKKKDIKCTRFQIKCLNTHFMWIVSPPPCMSLHTSFYFDHLENAIITNIKCIWFGMSMCWLKGESIKHIKVYTTCFFFPVSTCEYLNVISMKRWTRFFTWISFLTGVYMHIHIHFKYAFLPVWVCAFLF